MLNNTPKIIGNPEDGIYTIKIPDKNTLGIREIGFGFVHDYVHFDATCSIYTEGDIKLRKTYGACNSISIPVSVHIPIRDFNQLIIPAINSNKYCKPEHLVRTNEIPYAYDITATKYWDDTNKCFMVAFRNRGEIAYSHVTLSFYTQFIAPQFSRDNYGKKETLSEIK